MGRRVVITGLGIATALGIGVEENWQKLLKGISGIRVLDRVSPPVAAARVDRAYLKKMAEGVPDGPGVPLERKTLFALWAAGSALGDAGLLHLTGDRNRWGLFSSEGIRAVDLAGMARYLDQKGDFDTVRFLKRQDPLEHREADRFRGGGYSALVSETFDLRGPGRVITSACASATQAIGLGFRAVRRGDADLVVAGGSDSMTDPVGLAFFMLLTAASVSSGGVKADCRPFDRRRNGLVVGEGAGFLVLEDLSHATARGARVYAEAAGYGSSMDGFRLTAPDPMGTGAAKAMERALMDGDVGVEEIDYINAHGTGTRQNDPAETNAIKEVFGDRAGRLCISSSKSMIGHLMAASGGPECVYTVLTVKNDEIHPTINLCHPDPRCDLDYVPNLRRRRVVRAAVSNSFGFGGQNVSIVVRKFE